MQGRQAGEDTQPVSGEGASRQLQQGTRRRGHLRMAEWGGHLSLGPVPMWRGTVAQLVCPQGDTVLHLHKSPLEAELKVTVKSQDALSKSIAGCGQIECQPWRFGNWVAFEEGSREGKEMNSKDWNRRQRAN